MFKKFLIAILFTMICASSTVFAVDMLVGLDGKFLMQSGTKNLIAYEAHFNIPVATDTTKGYQFAGEISYVYSDKTGTMENEFLTETQAVKTMFTATKTLPSFMDFMSMKLGSGTWIFTKSGDDKEKTAFLVGLSASKWGFEVSAYCDVVKLDGPDLYAPSLGIKLLGL